MITVTITEQPLIFTITDNAAATPAAAIAEGIRNGIKGITEMSRDGKHRAFNRTGTLANGIEAVKNGDEYAIVAPLGYLEDDALFARLVALVPAIADPTTIPELDAAIERVTSDMVKLG